jgi:hypothetical protein
MNQGTKLVLDIAMGAVIPILILNFLTRPLGAPVAYVVAALVPVAWVAVDLLFITRSFNYITGFAGLSALVNGALAFWFVDGLLFALKDSAGFIVGAAVTAGSLVIARPLLKYFFIQIVKPDTPARRADLNGLLARPDIARAAALATLLICIQYLIFGIINFWLNATTVTAPFGTEAFNLQVAQVNGITRLVFPIPSIAVFGAAIYLIYRAVFRHLPADPGKSLFESDFWELMSRRDAATPPA